MLRCRVCALGDVPPSYWDLVGRYGAVYQTKPYLEALRCSGTQVRVALAYEGEQMQGGAALTLDRHLGPIWYSVDAHYAPVVASPEQAPMVLKCIADRLRSRALRFSITPLPEYAPLFLSTFDFSGWSKTESAYLVWDIAPDLSELTKDLPKGKKAAIKRALRENVVVQEIETADHVEEFYRLHHMSMTRGESLQAAPLRYYQCLFEMLRPQGMSAGFLALHPSTRQPIAAVVLLLGPNKRAVYRSVGHDYAYRQLGATDLLVSTSLQYLKERGYTKFDLVGLPLGDSARAQGIRHSKVAWAGAHGVEYRSCTCSRSMPGIGLATRGLKGFLGILKKKTSADTQATVEPDPPSR